LSGNLAFLNWLTITPALAAIDDALYTRFFPSLRNLVPPKPLKPASAISPRSAARVAFVLLIAFLSYPPLKNLASPSQVMNTSFDPLRLVNTYGAFGSVGKVRRPFGWLL
jgi:hypothetical protein